MSTLKYKTTERYGTGWTDPRMPSFRHKSLLRHGIPTQLIDASTEALHNLWLAKWGKRAALASDVHAAYAEGDGIMEVMQELYNRHLVKQVVDYRPDLQEHVEYYLLEKEVHANC